MDQKNIMLNQHQQVSFINLLDEISQKPNKFLAFRSINCLSSFLNGFMYIREQFYGDLQFDVRREFEYFNVFSKWLIAHFDADEYYSPYSVVLLHSKNEIEGFDKYFSLLKEFKQQHNIENLNEELQKRLVAREDKSSAKGTIKVLEPDGFYSLLGYVCKYPRMYLKSMNIDNLHSFVIGYLYAKEFFSIETDLEEKHFMQFQPWLEKKHSLVKGSSWARIINFYSTDEYNAVEVFSKYFDEFKHTMIDDGEK